MISRRFVVIFHFACKCDQHDILDEHISRIDHSFSYDNRFYIVYDISEDDVDDSAAGWRRRALGSMRRVELGWTDGLCGGLHLLVGEPVLLSVRVASDRDIVAATNMIIDKIVSFQCVIEQGPSESAHGELIP